MSGHTSGPWHACAGDGCEELRHRGRRAYFPHVHLGPVDHGRVGDLLVVNAGGGELAEHDANAYLIAAAPDLLAALRETARWCHQGHGDFPAKSCGLCRPVLAAIAKAEGKP